MSQARSRNNGGDEMKEAIYPMDKVLYKGNYYFVSTAHYEDNEGNQVVSLIREADMNSNRKTRQSIRAKAKDCKIIVDSPIRKDIESGKEPKAIYTEKDYE